MLSNIAGKTLICGCSARKYASLKTDSSIAADRFVTVFSFPFIKNLALLNRLKTYHILGSTIGIPGSGILEVLNVFPSNSFLTAAYIGVTGAGILSLASLPFTNTIGFLYISEDNTKIKISSVDFWGKRVDRIVSVDDWIPILEMPPRKTDILYLSPQLTDNSKYKWFVKFGNVLDGKKIGQVLE